MCGRFFIDEEDGELLAAMIEEAARRQQAIMGESTIAKGEVFPSAMVAALAMGRDGKIGAFPFQWGFHRADHKGLIINTRSETALEKLTFRTSMLERRCLIPCSWYFEWETRDGQENMLDGISSLQIQRENLSRGRPRNIQKIKYAIRPKRKGLMYLAAIYRYEETQKLPVLSILTREATEEIAFIHDRMPVIFTENTGAEWLNRAADPRAVLNDCEKEMVYTTHP
ncbi:MAG: SOS response-associated peptidase family protein [Clostridia bacterium]|nr:SOS response-associated peptidase family protein [Clostridia bacterium]MBR4537407.1 SOS response-associated peptidase family protein [Clostridia bacterium]